MIKNKPTRLPPFTIGGDAYQKIDEICSPYGRSAVMIGGETALAQAQAKIRHGCSLALTGAFVFGKEASYENVEALLIQPAVREADMIFAVGGGKALDTAKCTADRLGKPVFTFPTIASTCAASTSVSIMYQPDGRFLGPQFYEQAPVHVFIDTEILAAAPERYLWAGLGDSLAKYLESEMSSRAEAVPAYIAEGVALAKEGYEVILSCGRQALQANRAGTADEAFAKTAQAVISTIGYASIRLTADRVIDYNTGLAHAVFYAMTAYEHIEKEHLHGEVVALGCLILALVDRQTEFERLYAFNRWCRLPTQMEDLSFTPSMTQALLPKIAAMPDIAHSPYPISVNMLKEAFEELKIKNNI